MIAEVLGFLVLVGFWIVAPILILLDLVQTMRKHSRLGINRPGPRAPRKDANGSDREE